MFKIMKTQNAGGARSSNIHQFRFSSKLFYLNSDLNKMYVVQREENLKSLKSS